jgi:hypothetical protein
MGLCDLVTGSLIGFLGADGKEYYLPVTSDNPDGTGMIIPANGVNGAKLTNATEPILAMIANFNNYAQNYLMNRSSGVNASADHIAYPDNGTDTSGWIDMGITSSNFSQAAYAVTVANEGYLFMSALAASGKTGSLMIGTDSTGTANEVSIFTNGFTTKANICFTWDKNGNAIAKKGQADQSYSYQTPLTGATIVVANTSRTLVIDPAGTLAALTVQLPAAPIDGQLVEFSTSQVLTSLTVSPNGGQTMGNGLPTSAAAGQGFGFIYRLALTKWFRTY